MNKTRSFFLADRQISAWQNAWALVGDYLSAAAFLGAAGLYFTSGFDSFYYAIATLLGWPLLLILFADKLRQTDAYTLSQVLEKRFHSSRLRLLSASTSLCISVFYLLVQLVGAGKLLQVLFNIPYLNSLFFVCLFTLILVFSGGMKATTWVQIIKAILLFLCALVLVFLVLKKHHFSFYYFWHRVDSLSSSKALLPSTALQNPIEQISLILGLTLGLLGLPHVLMRFFTVKDSKAATLSAAYATALIALFFSFNLIIGYGAYILFFGQEIVGGNNMVLLYLGDYLAGNGFKWLISWMVFITILAVMSGLVLAASATISRDILPKLHHSENNNLRQSKLSIALLLLISAFLAYYFESFNIAFLFSLAFAWSASAHFPVLAFSFFYPSFTEKAAFFTLLTGALTSFIFIMLSPTVWENILGFDKAIFPYRNPTLFALPISLIFGYIFSKKNTDDQIKTS